MEILEKLRIRPLEWVEDDPEGPRLRWLDTRLLPWEEVYRETRDYRRVAEAIKAMEIRGAPAIGVAAAYGLALAAFYSGAREPGALWRVLQEAEKLLASTRPTAYNLFWALRRVMNRARASLEKGEDVDGIIRTVIDEAKKIHIEDIRTNMELGRIGAKLIDDGDTILTHCNAGALATAGYGTAEGIMRAAVEEGKRIRVIATETRPLLQGARLTVWELMKEGIEVRLITDNMVGYVMYRGLVDKVIVGADRITADGYVANKIGTYMIAALAYRHRIPFYVAAPSSTFDLSIEGDNIPIEERDPDEVRTVLGKVLITVKDVEVYNPAFDITPPELVTAIVTEKGIITPPYRENIARVLRGG
ncbi:methylthioribose-1-phosphate isomerase [Pyrodictium occultum]|uniref:Putative methylthioribose-1-phosphate isomerase n=1 Tax=Pyrodictium occultum TaxID=2309 RepID=A0A0V8RV27_PYROC|nr:S-methyl-5-thioribose-1-phosphate isomerase [Pyrodictium occultum]KSW11901.1 methylthioribose-1-phosphate isomerase [Pyrodictium occultum]